MTNKLVNKLRSVNKKSLIRFGIIILIVALVVSIAISIYNNNNKKAADARKGVACNIFTDNKADTLLAVDAALDSKEPIAESSDDISVSTCSYRQPGAGDKDKLIASLTVRTPLSNDGIATNKQAFKDKSIRDFPYGTAAFWVPKTGELNVLGKSNTWYSLSFGPQDPVGRNLGQTGQLATLLEDKLK